MGNGKLAERTPWSSEDCFKHKHIFYLEELLFKIIGKEKLHEDQALLA